MNDHWTRSILKESLKKLLQGRWNAQYFLAIFKANSYPVQEFAPVQKKNELDI